LPKIERDRRPNGGGATVELMKVLLRQVSDGHGVAARMIATSDDLEAICHDDAADVPALKGWRRDIFGRRALELKHGRLALTIERGKIAALEWREDENAPEPEPAPEPAAALREPEAAPPQSATAFERPEEAPDASTAPEALDVDGG
jgi:ribonuclease D